jgi:hypothetical protein
MSSANSNNKKAGQHWLILSHCFNMDGRAASQTITDKLPYLTQKDIRFNVISGVSGKRDTRFPHLQLWPWGPAGVRFDLRHVVAMKFGRGVAYRLIGLCASVLLAPFIVIERLLFGLQNQASWAFPAIFRSLLLIRKHRPDVVYSTGGAYSAHVAGYWLKRLTGIKWIAEIHDPMVIAGRDKTRNERYMAKVEGYICRNADLVWWFTEGALNAAQQRYPELGDRGITILPGVEPLQSDASYQRGEKMVIGHFGSLSTTRSLLPVVTAMADLLDKQPAIRANIRIHVYGGNIDAAATREIEQQGLGDVFVCFGRLEQDPLTGKSGRERVIDLMYQVDCLLLQHGNIADCREYIPSKLYEYFWAGRPVIALTYQNPQLNRMLGERNAYIAASDQQGEIIAALERAYQDWAAGQLKPSGLPGISPEQAVDSILNALK